MPKIGEETKTRFDRVADTFVERGAKRSQMFGMPVLKIRDKVFAGDVRGRDDVQARAR